MMLALMLASCAHSFLFLSLRVIFSIALSMRLWATCSLDASLLVNDVSITKKLNTRKPHMLFYNDTNSRVSQPFTNYIFYIKENYQGDEIHKTEIMSCSCCEGTVVAVAVYEF